MTEALSAQHRQGFLSQMIFQTFNGYAMSQFNNAGPALLAARRPYDAGTRGVEGVHQGEYERLRGELQSAHHASRLPEVPSEETKAELNDLLVRLRFSR